MKQDLIKINKIAAVLLLGFGILHSTSKLEMRPQIGEEKTGMYFRGVNHSSINYMVGNGYALLTNEESALGEGRIFSDVMFLGKPSKDIAIGGTLRFFFNMNGFYDAGTELLKVREIFIKWRIKDSFNLDVGTFYSSLSPLTLWHDEDNPLLESYLASAFFNFASYDARQNNANDIYLEGAQVALKSKEFSALDILAGGKILGSLVRSRVSSSFDRLLYGAQVYVKSSIEDIYLGVQGLSVQDLASSGSGYPLESYTASAEAFVDVSSLAGLNEDIVSFSMHSEAGYGWYNNGFDKTWAQGTAYYGGFNLLLLNTVDLGFAYRYIMRQYVAIPSQQADYTFVEPALSKQTNFTPNIWDRTYRERMFYHREYDVIDNYSLPMGRSTPNRKGVEITVEETAIDLIHASAIVASFNEVSPVGNDNIRNFKMFSAGLKLDPGLDYIPLLYASCTGEMVSRDDDVRTAGDELEDIKTLRVSGALVEPLAKFMDIVIGYERFQQNGRKTIDMYVDDAGFEDFYYVRSYGSRDVDTVDNIFAGGVVLKFGKKQFVAELNLFYTYSMHIDNKDKGNDYNVHNGKLYVTAQF
jgi:hypothetical protein